MSELIRVAAKEEIPEGTGKVVEVSGKTIAVFNCDGRFYATANVCPHRGGSLGEGCVSGSSVSCPWHGWEFDVTTGRCLTNPSAAVEVYDVQIQGDDILVAA